VTVGAGPLRVGVLAEVLVGVLSWLGLAGADVVGDE
jgi:hypothetical protein